MITSTLPTNMTPYERFYGCLPSVAHLRVWGVPCFVHIPLDLQSKLGNKSYQCLFMDYPPGQKGYHMRNCSTLHFFTSSNVIFDENIPYSSTHDFSITPPSFPSLSSVPPCPCTPLITPPPFIPPPTPHPPACTIAHTRPAHDHILTQAGQQYYKQIEAEKAHSEQSRTTYHALASLASDFDAVFTCLIQEGAFDVLSPVAALPSTVVSNDPESYLV